MSTRYLYNGFGAYDNGGVTLTMGGVSFTIPFQGVLPIPNYAFRELDHDKSTPSAGYTAALTYMTNILQGETIVQFLTEGQVPDQHKDMGIMVITGKPTGKSILVSAGYDSEGFPVMTEVQEIEPTRAERETAATLAQRYKEKMVQDYFQSKREAMSSGRGRRHPDARIREYMDELGVQDNDDITSHQKSASGLTPELIELVMRAASGVAGENKEAIAEALAAAKARPKSLGLADNARKYDEAQKAK